jgi:hypothetical protein
MTSSEPDFGTSYQEALEMLRSIQVAAEKLSRCTDEPLALIGRRLVPILQQALRAQDPFGSPYA